jgi:hypothetical protein
MKRTRITKKKNKKEKSKNEKRWCKKIYCFNNSLIYDYDVIYETVK